MTARVDNHSHIILADIRDMVARAEANLVREYSVTEHVSQFKELRESVKFGSTHSKGKMFRSLKEYNDEFLKLDKKTDGVRVNRGLEVDFSPRFEDRVGEFVNQASWDILLCSVHEFENARDVERKVGETDGSEATQSWRSYFRLEQLALESDFVPFDVLAHPVRMSRGQAAAPPDVERLLLELAVTARRRGKALELNGSDLDYAPQLVRGVAMACSIAGCKVSLGSDAHHRREVFRNIQVAMGLVEEFKLEQYSPRSRR